jgi:aromatic-L-amino-acid/L-tryptophan decarboxylase
VLFRSGADPDALNSALVPALLETGEAMVTSTVLRDRRWLRMCTINPRTTDADLDGTIQRLDALSRSLAGSSLR